MPSLIVLCYAMFSPYPWEACSFLKENGEVDLREKAGGGGTGRRGGKRTVIRMYCISEE